MHKLGHRNTGPFGDHLGDVVFGDLLTQQRLLLTVVVVLAQCGLFLSQLLLECGQCSVFQLSCLVEVITALGLVHLQLHTLNLLLEVGKLINRSLLLLPLSIESALLL